MRRGLALAAAAVGLLLVAAAVVVGVRWWPDRDRTTFEEATAYAPADAQRLSWTDWAAVRTQVGARLDADSTRGDVEQFLDRAYDEDLTSTSALVESAPVLQTEFGFSPASVDWELFSQSEDGAVVIVRLPDDDALDGVADDLAAAGFTEPNDGDGVWMGGDDLLPGIGAGLTPELQYVALDRDEGLVLTSDRADYLKQVVDGLGDDPLPEPVRQVVDASGEAVSAVVYDGAQACSALAMSQAAAEEQATADRLLEEAGGIDPLTAYAMSARAGATVLVAMAFANEEQARTNAESRGRLAAGPAPGQGGDFSDRFDVAPATAEGDVVTLELTPLEGTFVLSDLSAGPVLFATC